MRSPKAGGPLVEKAILAATQAQAAWAGLELDTRLAVLERAADTLDRDGAALVLGLAEMTEVTAVMS